MANALYPKTKARMMRAAINLAATPVHAILVDTAAYTYNSAHEFLSAVPAGARVATFGPLANPTIDNNTGKFDSDDPIFPNVSGATIEAIILYLSTGNDATSRLLLFQDTGITGAPVTPVGTGIQVFVDAANGWFIL